MKCELLTRVSGLSLVGPRGWETEVRCYHFWRERVPRFDSFCCGTHHSRRINLFEGFGFPPVEGPIDYSDSSAARGIANRKGVGKLKNLQVRSLWLQQARVDGQVNVDRVDSLRMLPLPEHERRLERVVDGRSAKDVSRR